MIQGSLRSRVFEKRSKFFRSFPCRSGADLWFDGVLSDVIFSRFSSQFFCLSSY